MSTVSRRVADLEAQLEVRLLERSTRRLRLTDVGADVLQHAERGSEIAELVNEIVSTHRSNVSGTLRLSAPPSLSQSLLAPVIEAFQRRYSDVRVQVFVTERDVDFVNDGVDLALDISSERNPALDYRRILTYRHELVASPAYRGAHRLDAPGDLIGHALLTFSYGTVERTWRFEHVKTGERREIAFRPYLSMNDYLGLAHALAGGSGVGELPPIVAPELFRDGHVVRVLPAWQLPRLDLSIARLRNRFAPRPARAFVEFASPFIANLFPALASNDAETERPG